MIHIVVSISIFLGGTFLLIYSVEKFIENLTKSAFVLGVSTFLLAVIFAGMDFENWAFGIAAILGNLPGVAIGSAIGSALFLIGAAVALGGFLTPFKAKVPKIYLLLMIISPLVLLGFLLDGKLFRVEGVGLLLIFGLFVFYIYRKETKGEGSYLRAYEVEEAGEKIGERKWLYPLLMVLFIAGIALGSEAAVHGARGLLEGFGLNETIFGMTIVGLVMSLEEILLVVEPVRKGRESIALGNIIGSLIFFSTGNVGLLALTRGFSIEDSVLSFYWPYLFGATLLVGMFLLRGKLGRQEGVLLALLYISYWVLSYIVV